MPAYPPFPGSRDMPLNRARILGGQTYYVIFRATGGECAWMESFDARKAVKEFPNEWSPHPWPGQTYGSPRDVFAVEAGRGGLTPTSFPTEWWS